MLSETIDRTLGAGLPLEPGFGIGGPGAGLGWAAGLGGWADLLNPDIEITKHAC